MSIGSTPPVGGYYNPNANQENPLDTMVSCLRQLSNRLAPAQVLQIEQLSEHPIGMTKTVSLTGNVNGIMVSIPKGTIEVFFGNSVTGVPNFTFYPATNPVLVPLPMITERTITIRVATESETTATGSIYFMCY
jgi:hypothetical protein